MVLQNKYKARASRRYNAARGGASDGRGRDGAGRGRGGARHYTQEAFPSLRGEAEENTEGSDSREDKEDDDDNDGESSKIDKKYARRAIQSNAWRYAEPEIDAKEENVEEEPEVDLSGLLERVARLDSSRTTQALSSREAAKSSIQEDEDDIDHTLSHILEKQRERERGKATLNNDFNNQAAKSNRLTSSELKMLEMEGKRLLEEKEREVKHYGKAQGLKSQQPKTISINIGENQRKKKEDDGQAKRPGEVVRREINLAALYGDEEDAIAAPHLKEEANNSLTIKKTAVQTIPDHDKGERISAPLKEHEDFLDSIM